MAKYSVIFSITCISGLALIQILFFSLQTTQAINAEKSIRSLLRNEINLREPYRLAQGISDLEAIGVFRCSVLVDTWRKLEFQNLQFKQSQCDQSFIQLNGRAISTSIIGADGRDWSISFLSNNPSSFYLALWITRICFLLSLGLIAFILLTIRKAILDKENHAVEMANLSAQVAHDIRSPLTALNIALKEVPLPSGELEKAIKLATSRINDTAENLLNKVRGHEPCVSTNSDLDNLNPHDNKMLTHYFLGPIIEDIVAEKRLEFSKYSHIQIEFLNDVRKLESLSLIERDKLQRILSNVINNSREAIGANVGLIRITLNRDEKWNSISIEDDGPGIPSVIRSRIGREKLSTKNNGNGIGLFTAKAVIGSWGGKFGIEPREEGGTIIKIHLPVFSKAIDAVLIENEEVTRRLWHKSAAMRNITMVSASSFKEFSRISESLDLSIPIFIDVKLGDENGAQIGRQLFSQGFRKISLATAYPRSHFGRDWQKSMPWINEIRDKVPPWVS